MAGLDPAIHAVPPALYEWMPESSPAMTVIGKR
jgi:hypothetical protein